MSSKNVSPPKSCRYDTEYDKEVTELFEKAINNYKEFDFDYYFEKWGETRKRIKKLYWI